eukprot:CAMPEP_0204602134 /NCGR_PEP_ID=MMETSP0661-20131031/56469_1 /ASSEMBLY_ACC=CAM_ASM_000606 /TAXON_ID=109239 /ORGANISM="Alexandrium margalefi, Strain AMGDE01CS-322" /LENGTH=87 /DNA_ID=CAMNT_0051613069 /DNA_START=405 /DNA_END=665 /DNA_ORIENTATION=+
MIADDVELYPNVRLVLGVDNAAVLSLGQLRRSQDRPAHAPCSRQREQQSAHSGPHRQGEGSTCASFFWPRKGGVGHKLLYEPKQALE